MHFLLNISLLSVLIRGPGDAGGSPAPGVALMADYSDVNTNEAWVFW